MPVAIPSWFIVVPFATGIIPLVLLIVVLLRKNKDASIPLYIFTLPIIMFIIPMMFLILYMAGYVSIPFLIVPIFTGLVPMMFLFQQMQHVKQYMPEGKVFEKARLLRAKGKFASVIMVCEGNDIAKFGCIETDPQSGKIIFHTENYGIKPNPAEYPNIPSMKTADGVGITIVSPLQITPTNAESELAIDLLLEKVRGGHKEFNHLNNLQLTTLLVKQGSDLVEDAHLFMNRNDKELTEEKIVDTVTKIQDEANIEITIYPNHHFMLFRKFQEVVNCAYTGSFIKDFENLIRAFTLEEMDKSKQEKILLYACFICAILVVGVISAILIKKFI